MQAFNIQSTSHFENTISKAASLTQSGRQKGRGKRTPKFSGGQGGKKQPDVQWDTGRIHSFFFH